MVGRDGENYAQKSAKLINIFSFSLIFKSMLHESEFKINKIEFFPKWAFRTFLNNE